MTTNVVLYILGIVLSYLVGIASGWVLYRVFGDADSFEENPYNRSEYDETYKLHSNSHVTDDHLGMFRGKKPGEVIGDAPRPRDIQQTPDMDFSGDPATYAGPQSIEGD